MKERIAKNRQAVGVVVIVALALIYYFFFYSSSPSTPALSSVTANDASPTSQQLLVTLASLHTIKLDNTLFQDPVFMSLSDYGVTIPTQPVGRRNPFAPIEGMSMTQPAATSSPIIKVPSLKK